MRPLPKGGLVMWEKDQGKSQEHWLELNAPDGWYHAIVKLDGCVHLYHAGNVPFGPEYGRAGENRPEPPACDDYIHICDVDDLIARLQALKAKALEHFGDWPL